VRLCKRCGKPLSFFAGYVPLKGEMCAECYNHELSEDAQKKPWKNQGKAVKLPRRLEG